MRLIDGWKDKDFFNDGPLGRLVQEVRNGNLTKEKPSDLFTRFF